MITVHIQATHSQNGKAFTGYVRIDEDGCQEQLDGEFSTKINIAKEFGHILGEHCEEVIIDVTGYEPGTYTFE